MNTATELLLADSELATIESRPEGLVLTLSAAAVRRHDSGRVSAGYVQRVRIVLEGAEASASFDVGQGGWGGIKEGRWTTAGQVQTRLSGLLSHGPGRLHLVFHRGDPFEVAALSLRLIWPDDDRFHESFAC